MADGAAWARPGAAASPPSVTANAAVAAISKERIEVSFGRFFVHRRMRKPHGQGGRPDFARGWPRRRSSTRDGRGLVPGGVFLRQEGAGHELDLMEDHQRQND